MHASLVVRMPAMLRGIVSKAKVMQKTCTVMVPRQAVDKRTRKDVIKHTKYLVHDPEEVCNVHDVVRIEHSRPLSARKRFVLQEVERKAERSGASDSTRVQAMIYGGLKLGAITQADLDRRVQKEKLARKRERRAARDAWKTAPWDGDGKRGAADEGGVDDRPVVEEQTVYGEVYDLGH